MDAEVDKKDQEFVDLTDQSKERIVDMTSMEEESEQKGANEETKDDMSLGLGSEREDNQATNSNKSDEADRAGTGDSGSGSFDKDCNDEQDRRYDNKVKTPGTFLEKLWNEKGSSTEALKEACSDLKEQMILAGKEEEEQLQLTGYSDDLIQSLKEEKGSVAELITLMDEMIASFQEFIDKGGEEEEAPITNNKKAEDKMSDEVEEAGKTKKDKGKNEMEEDEFLDAKEEASITSNTSKTQQAAGDSQHGTAKVAVPHPFEKEGGQEVTAAPGHGDG